MRRIVITSEMANRLLGEAKVKVVCQRCGQVISSRRGKFPTQCPTCGAGFVISEGSVVDYYSILCDAFLSQTPQVQHEHKLSRPSVLRDLLRFEAQPFLFSLREHALTDELLECLCFLNFPQHNPVTADVLRLYEAAYDGGDAWSYHGAKVIGLYPDLVATEKVLRETITTARKLLYAFPAWLTPAKKYGYPGLTEGRHREIIAEGYGYARQFLNHSEALEYCHLLPLHEAAWLTYMPPSSIRRRRDQNIHQQVAGGFRFKLKSDPKNRLAKIRRRLIAKKNHIGGIATNLTSVRQAIQRTRARRKATAWHKVNPQSPRLHKALGTLLHRSRGTFAATTEGHAQLKHIRASENSLRLFSDGTAYHDGQVLFFEKTNQRLIESLFRPGDVYALKTDVISTIYFPQGDDIRLMAGTRIRVEDLTIADAWEGEYPQSPIGQWVVGVEVLTGPHQGEFIEFDGADLSLAVGIDEGVLLNEAPRERPHPHGAVYLHTRHGTIREVVLSAYDYLLTEQQVGAVLRRIRRTMGKISPDAQIRVYNDGRMYEVLNHEIQRSKLSKGHRLAKRTDLMEVYEPVTADVYAGGPGAHVLDKAVHGYFNNDPDEIVKLLPGTRVNVRTGPTGQRELIVLSGPYQGRIIVIREDCQHTTFAPDLSRIHELYRSMLCG